MNRKTQMTGLRLGFTYAAALVVLALLIAMLTAPSNAGPDKGVGSTPNLSG